MMINGTKSALTRLGLWLVVPSLLCAGGCGTPANSQESIPPFLPDVTGDYLGQPPPDMEFERFASGIVPSEMYHSVTVAPDGREIYWAERQGIMWTRRIRDRWTVPALVWFSGGSGADFLDDAPVVSPDNQRLYFTSRRHLDSNTESGTYRFWFSERTADGWGAPQVMPDMISSLGGTHWQVSVSNAGTFFFGVYSESAGSKILYSELVDGAYTTPQPLEQANRLGHVNCPFVAPDESYVVFHKLDAGHNWSEGYFISFRGSDGHWMDPRELPALPEPESVFVSRDGRYIFNKANWASAQMIERLRPGEER